MVALPASLRLTRPVAVVVTEVAVSVAALAGVAVVGRPQAAEVRVRHAVRE